MTARALERATRWALVAAAVVLPFELQDPVIRVAGLALTTAELPIYVALLLSVAWCAVRRRLHWTRASTVVVTWAAVVLLSALLAPVERGAALKFALRQVGGAALFLAAADAVAAGAGGAIAIGLLAGATLSALAGILEVLAPGLAGGLLLFKAAATRSGGVLRASGTLQYATIAAMVWEAGLALAVGCAGAAAGWRGWCVPATVVLAQALVLTGSRAGLLVAGVVVAGVGLAGWKERSLRTGAFVACLALVTFAAWDVSQRPLLRRPLGPASAEAWFQAEYSPQTSSLELRAGEPVRVGLMVRNTGLLSWSSGGAHPMSVGSVWQDRLGTAVAAGPPASFSRDVEPGDERRLDLDVVAPPRTGDFVLAWRLVQDGVAWSSENHPGGIRVHVLPGAPLAAAATRPEMPVQHQPTRLALWRAGIALWRGSPWLGVGPDNFRHLYWQQLGPRRLDDRIHANSLYVEALADTGALGVLAWAALVAVLVGATRAAWRRSPAARGIVAGAACGLAAFLLHGCVDFFLPFTAGYGFFWLLAALIAGLAYGPERMD